MSKPSKRTKPVSRQIDAVWQVLRAVFLASAVIGLSACVVLPADTVIYDDEAATDSGSSSSPDVVIIDRGPVYVPPPIFWHDSHWGHRHGYRHRSRHGYRDGRRPRSRSSRNGARWEGRQRRGGAERGARQRNGAGRGTRQRNGAERGTRQRSGEFRGRTRSGSSPRSMTPHLDTK